VNTMYASTTSRMLGLLPASRSAAHDLDA